jgi:hypothetical protein
MRKWRVSVSWETEVEAEDEGQALIDADAAFSFMSEASAEEITPDDPPPALGDSTRNRPAELLAKRIDIMTYEEMKPFQRRVADEVRELRGKLDKLNQFVQTEMFNQLPEAEKDRMYKQRVLMNSYADVLDERIAAFV